MNYEKTDGAIRTAGIDFSVLLSGFSLDAMEKLVILINLKANNWNILRTAKVLNIDRRTLQRKIVRYDLRNLIEVGKKPETQKRIVSQCSKNDL